MHDAVLHGRGGRIQHTLHTLCDVWDDVADHAPCDRRSRPRSSTRQCVYICAWLFSKQWSSMRLFSLRYT